MKIAKKVGGQGLEEYACVLHDLKRKINKIKRNQDRCYLETEGKAEVVHIYNTGTWETKAGVLLQILSCHGLYFMFRVSLGYGVRSFLKTIK